MIDKLELESLVRQIDAGLGVVPQYSTSAELIRILDNGELALRSLEDAHPFDALLGFVAPDNWQALGVVAPGNGTKENGEQVRVRVVYMVHRDGSEASLLRMANDKQPIAGNEHTPGRVADCLRRALDLPTPAESDDLLVAVWLPPLLADMGRTARFNTVQMSERLAAVPKTWGEHRWRSVQYDDNPHMDSAVAAWMDDGMYARFMLSVAIDEYPTTDLPELMRKAKLNAEPAAWGQFLRETTGLLGDAILQALK